MCLKLNGSATQKLKNRTKGKNVIVYKIYVKEGTFLKSSYQRNIIIPDKNGKVFSDRNSNMLNTQESHHGMIEKGIHCFLNYKDALDCIAREKYWFDSKMAVVVPVLGNLKDLVGVGHWEYFGSKIDSVVFSQIKILNELKI